MPARLLQSPSAVARLDEAARWLADQPAAGELLLLGGAPDAVADLVRRTKRPATFGWHRLSLPRLAQALAAPALLAQGRVFAPPLALEALWARVVWRLARDGRLGRFATIADRPGLPRALARTVDELRLEGVEPAADPDLATVSRAFDEALGEAGFADASVAFRLAAEALEGKSAPYAGLPTLLLDVRVQTKREQALVEALARRTSSLVATVPAGEDRTRARLEQALGVRAQTLPTRAPGALARVQENLFGAEQPAIAPPGPEVEILSAPGEMRECLEIARRLQQEAAAGVPFDQIAVLLRAPGTYRATMVEALRRSGVPAFFARGTRAPDPAGRALLALLACAEEGASASRFAEYLSLGEVPRPTDAGAPPAAPPAADRWAPSDEDERPQLALELEADLPDEDTPVAAPAVRAPRRWERLLVDAAVIGGRERWERRLSGLARSLELERAEKDNSEAQLERIDRNLADLASLRAFALPLLDLLTELPKVAPWGEWLDRLSALCERALRHPHRCLGILAELGPMADVGPVGLAEVRQVLSARLLELPLPHARRRFGRVFVGPVEAARGLAFERVFIPGLAERIFPQRVREDPIATDAGREKLGGGLALTRDRVASERFQLQLAVGAAKAGVVLSYPRIDVREGRPRVPSFYGLEALRAAEGTLPRYEDLARRAERAVDARLGWPAPKDPATAVDAAERDLSILDGLFRSGGVERGRAHYLLDVNPFLARALRFRFARWQRKWTYADGMVAPSAEAQAALAAHRLGARSFSATALQRMAECPYRFFLHTVVGLSPREEPEAIEELNPLQRGSVVHEVQYRVLSALRDEGRLPLDPAHLEEALARVDRELHDVAEEYEERLAPAIDRIWKDGLVAISADVREWLRQMARASQAWAPWKFELAFGLGHREQEDPESRKEPISIPELGLAFRGSIDLVEKSPEGKLRATDYKTGRQRTEAGTVIGGGAILQPVLYALALEQLFPNARVEGGRLFYCTQAGGFSEVSIPLDDDARAAAKQAISVIAQALEKGFFPAAPDEDQCTWCDYRTVCGAYEPRRIAKKPKADLQTLQALRGTK